VWGMWYGRWATSSGHRSSRNIVVFFPGALTREAGRFDNPTCPNQLFDLLIGAKQYRWGYGETERLGGLEVHDHLEFDGKLHREIARLRATQNAIDIGGGATKRAYTVGSAAQQT